MVTENKGRERRRHERFATNDHIFVTFRPHFDRIGSISDISKGGVSLEYPVIQEYAALTDNLRVDIFCSTKKLELSNVPCRLIYDERVNNGKGFLKTIETRRCGLEFAGLSQWQAARLDAELKECRSIQ
jgi:hypothetical protein